ncbi:S8 family peptidase [Paenibacillus sp. R14(2021)]|uniref:S8 family peptidase n=1 Tax=Paenibacillus sp. R14(2021) TaxID=2859228 RepID=UPI0021580D87|nr:S8 family peptidase [Paenibacillus sp. R14(2021)]
MPKVEKLLLSCSSARPSAHTSRTLIGFKSREQYMKCIKQLANFGIRPVKIFRRGRAIVCHVDSRFSEQLQSLARHPDINYIEPDFKIHAHGFVPAAENRSAGGGRQAWKSSTPLVKKQLRLSSRANARGEDDETDAPWNIKQVQAPKVWPTTRGSASGIGIIDTGIARHSDLYVTGGVNTMGGSSYLDDNGHGTHVAGIAAALGKNGMQPGVAPRAKLYAIKALDANGSGYVSDLIKGIEWCIKKKIPIINMSLGLSGENSNALKEAVERARKSGIVVIASAGNSGPNNSGGIDQPARFSDAIAVASSTRSGKTADYSSRGSGIDVTAPGSYIRSTWPGGGYMVLSGTSMSCPHVAAGAALLKSLNPGLSPSGVAKLLRSSAKKLSGDSSSRQGYGLVQLFDAASLSHKSTETARASKRTRTKSSKKK